MVQVLEQEQTMEQMMVQALEQEQTMEQVLVIVQVMEQVAEQVMEQALRRSHAHANDSILQAVDLVAV